MDNKGFARYGSFPKFQSFEDAPIEKKDVKSPQDVLFDKIFACDSYGWPTTSVSRYLSEKTSDDVRSFIERNLLVDHSETHLINNEKVVAEFNKLQSDFIAESSRNRFESIEDYEKRLQSIIQREDENSYQKKAKELRDNFFKKLNGK